MDTLPRWYISSSGGSQGKILGPFSTREILEHILAKRLGWADFVSDSKSWIRICASKDFESYLPKPPDVALLSQIGEARKTVPNQKEWFIQQDNSESGPYSEADIEILSPKVSHVWKEGMEDWKPLQNRRVDRRSSPRKPVIAKVVMVGQSEQAPPQVSTGICRDLSMGGLQVLSAEWEGEVQDRVLLNVTSEGLSFSCEAIVVRTFDDIERGFSCRFDSPSPQTQEALKNYFASRGPERGSG